MTETYFRQMQAETPTRAWVNNPTLEEVELALAQSAVGCTTNPAYGGGLLKRAPELVLPIIRELVRSTDDDAKAAWHVQERLVAPIVSRFRPLYEASAGRHGYVSIQGSPDADTDADAILAEAHAGHALGPNAAPKLPATEPGLRAFESVVAAGYPVIVTEVFSVAQLIATCERYLSVTSRTGVFPPFFLSPITGIFGDHLKAIAVRDGLAIRNEDAELVGVALSRACYALVKERGYPVMLLCGGARIPFDLTGLVGADVHCTINWSTFAQLIADPAPFAQGYDTPIDAAVIDRLCAAVPDVEKALRHDGLTVDEFETFGPVQHFRNNFLAGWRAVREAIAAERSALLTAGLPRS
ncbi:MAG TPA: transaldolase family protein [Thermomicrobiaceae bacterium]|nr:transaldolase family protein [Thermomicrobiaceae bacterium]